MNKSFFEKPSKTYAVYHLGLDRWLAMGQNKKMDNYPNMVMPAPAYFKHPNLFKESTLLGWYKRMSSYFNETNDHIMIEVDKNNNFIFSNFIYFDEWIKEHE